MTTRTFDRRTYLGGLGLGCALLLGGCVGAPQAAAGDAPADGGDGGGDAPPDFDGWFADVGNFDGVADRTGMDTVSVTVGASGNGGAYAFDPAAVEVTAGTTVVWSWTGEGGMHDVTHEDGAFESELTDDADYTFEHVFDAPGIYKYVCTPHEGIGMKGAVVVSE